VRIALTVLYEALPHTPQGVTDSLTWPLAEYYTIGTIFSQKEVSQRMIFSARGQITIYSFDLPPSSIIIYIIHNN
jgi:hypothetical protein